MLKAKKLASLPETSGNALQQQASAEHASECERAHLNGKHKHLVSDGRYLLYTIYYAEESQQLLTEG